VARRSGVCVKLFCAREDFWLLRRRVTTVASRHAVHHSTSPRSGLNFRHDVGSRRTASEFANSVPFPTGNRVAGKTTTNDEEKRILALVKTGESNPGPEHFTDGCRRQAEETKKRECRYPSRRTSRDSHATCTARDYCTIDSAHDRRQGIRYSGTGRWSWTGLG